MTEKPKRNFVRNRQRYPLNAKMILIGFCLIFCGLVAFGFSVPKTVSVAVDDSDSTSMRAYETTCRSVEDFLQTHNIDYAKGRDAIDVSLEEPIKDGMILHITKEFEIELIADGEKSRLHVLPMRVADVLKQQGIQLSGEDYVKPAADSQVSKGMQIKVYRVTHKKVKEKRAIDFEVVYQASNKINIGDVQVTQDGRKGTQTKTYDVTYVNGKKTEKKLVKTETTRAARSKVISYGTKIAFGKPAGLKYKQKFTGVRAVSYYFGGTPVGAYGLPCEYGTVAVDKNLIPLGSLLYIEGYGYAIANDVGSAIKGKTVDLYMERLEQCVIWGARWTTVYVL